MQIWIFFFPGAGGDGIVNLIEHAQNFVPFDDSILHWRIHRIVDNKPKFWAPTVDIEKCFRTKQPFKSNTNKLTLEYQSCIEQNKNCVVSSHDINLKLLNSSDRQDIFCQNQIKVLLTSDPNQIRIDSTVKNLMPIWPQMTQDRKVDRSHFDIVIDAQKMQTDWYYVLDFCQQFGIDLDIDQYHEYQEILKGNFQPFLNNLHPVEQYTSNTDGKTISYNLIKVWPPK